MNSKIISALINAIISFAVLMGLSFLMNKMLNHSNETFLEFFQEKWKIFLGMVIIFTIYSTFIRKPKP